MAAKLVEATQPFVCEHDGQQVLIAVGTRVAASSKLAKAHPDLFEPVEPKADIA